MSKILDWFQGNLADYSTWVAVCGVIAAFSSLTLSPVQIAAIATLGATLFTVRDKHIVAAGGHVKRFVKRETQPEPDEHETLDDLISRGRK